MVAIENPKKCPNCGSDDFELILPVSGTTYVLTTADQTKNPPAFHATDGIPVNIFGCVNCGVATFHIPSLKRG